MIYKIDFLKIFAKITGKHLYQSPFLNKITGLNLQLILKKALEYFPVNFEKFLRTPFKNSFIAETLKYWVGA